MGSILTLVCYQNIADAPEILCCDDQMIFIIATPGKKQLLQITTEVGAMVMSDAHCSVSEKVRKNTGQTFKMYVPTERLFVLMILADPPTSVWGDGTCKRDLKIYCCMPVKTELAG